MSIFHRPAAIKTTERQWGKERRKEKKKTNNTHPSVQLYIFTKVRKGTFRL